MHVIVLFYSFVLFNENFQTFVEHLVDLVDSNIMVQVWNQKKTLGTTGIKNGIEKKVLLGRKF